MLSEGQHLLVDRTKNDLSKSWCSHLQYSFANSTTSSRSCSDLRSSISKIVACASIERVDVRLDDILAFKLSVIFTTVDSASITSTDNKKRNSRTHSSAIIVFIPPPDGPQSFVLQNGLLIIENVHWAAIYFTHSESYYSVPEKKIALEDIPKKETVTCKNNVYKWPTSHEGMGQGAW